jgi:hypothetical protein
VTKMLFLSAIIIIIICFICFRFHNFTFAFFDCNDYGLGIYLLKGLRRSFLDILRFESMYRYIQPWEWNNVKMKQNTVMYLILKDIDVLFIKFTSIC